MNDDVFIRSKPLAKIALIKGVTLYSTNGRRAQHEFQPAEITLQITSLTTAVSHICNFYNLVTEPLYVQSRELQNKFYYSSEKEKGN
jgi:hypothetical protein